MRQVWRGGCGIADFDASEAPPEKQGIVGQVIWKLPTSHGELSMHASPRVQVTLSSSGAQTEARPTDNCTRVDRRISWIWQQQFTSQDLHAVKHMSLSKSTQ